MPLDGRMFQTGARKGELHELRMGLNATNSKERKNALKRTVAAMTLGRDVSSLFTDVVKNTAGDLSVKKLVYLYIINYAQAVPNLAILIVNTFIKDAKDYNPLIRALAIRTMALIPLQKITEHLFDPLHSALHDADPYVRKTAAVCVAKLYDTNPELAVEEGFIEELQQLLLDVNPMTVSNAVAALCEIAETSGNPGLLSITAETVPRFLAALSECTEWGQIFILDAIASYQPADSQEADSIVERIVPRLQHANSAVVLAAVQIIINLMPSLDSDEKRDFLINKMGAPLISLLAAPPELQFVALRNFSLIIPKYPELLRRNINAFFASYSDPLYVKTEKLNILVQLVDETNAPSVFSELLEYTGAASVSFAQKAVSSVSQIALRLPQLSGECIQILSDVLTKNVPHLTEGIAIALQDILRCYPRQFDDIVTQLCECSGQVENPDAKGALVWIIGEHADRLVGAASMLRIIANEIHKETVKVKQQVLTASVKAFVLNSPGAEEVLERMIRYTTEQSDNIDLRNRGFIYKRLLDHGVETTQKIVQSNKFGIERNNSCISPELRAELLGSLSSIASVYHRQPLLFRNDRERILSNQEADEVVAEEDLLDLGHSTEQPSVEIKRNDIAGVSTSAGVEIGDSMLEEVLGTSSSILALPPPSGKGSDILDVLGLEARAETQNSSPETETNADLLISADQGQGLQISGSLAVGDSGSVHLLLNLQNQGQTPMGDFAIQLNTNMFSLILASPMPTQQLFPGKNISCNVPLQFGGEGDVRKGFTIQIAMKFTPGGVVYFALDVSLHLDALFNRRSGPLRKSQYLATWRRIPDNLELTTSVELAKEAVESIEWILKKLESIGIFTVAKRLNAQPPEMFLSTQFVGSSEFVILAELKLPSPGSNVGKLSSRCTFPSDLNSSCLTQYNQLCSQLIGR